MKRNKRKSITKMSMSSSSSSSPLAIRKRRTTSTTLLLLLLLYNLVVFSSLSSLYRSALSLRHLVHSTVHVLIWKKEKRDEASSSRLSSSFLLCLSVVFPPFASAMHLSCTVYIYMCVCFLLIGTDASSDPDETSRQRKPQRFVSLFLFSFQK